MVGSGAAGGGGDHARSKEAAGMMALHEALRNVCLSSDWTYSVFWTIRPRPYAPLSCLPFSSSPCTNQSSSSSLCFSYYCLLWVIPSKKRQVTLRRVIS